MNRISITLKKRIRRVLDVLNLEIRMSKPVEQYRRSLPGCLHHLRSAGASFNTVLDGGAAYGDWSRECNLYFPLSHYLLVEPLKEYLPVLQDADVGQSCKYIQKVLGPKEDRVNINVHPDYVGSSLYGEVEGSVVDGSPRSVSMTTIDNLLTEYDAPFLLKLDLQGAEMDALEGALSTLSSSNRNVVIVEITLFDSLIDSRSSFLHLIPFMSDQGYVLYDIFGFAYRPLDNALIQVDCVFVHKQSPLRKTHAYANPEYRKQQFDQSMEKHLGRIRAAIKTDA